MFGSRKTPNELPIPLEVPSDEDARELIRAWVAHKGLHCSLSDNNWGDNERAAWGILLGDIVQQIANAIHDRKGADKAETMREIQRVFNEKMGSLAAGSSSEAKTA
jgi:hypothetical protein